MKSLTTPISLLTTIVLTLAMTSCYHRTDSPRGSWAKGADLSWLSEMEHDSMFHTDQIAALRDIGMNAVRLRVWVNHKTGWSNLPDMLSLAARAARQGQRLMIDIHYSDFFADPSHQTIPEAWQAYDFPTMREAVREHTLQVLNTLKEAGIKPEWVQIGNETPNGMLWPVAKVERDQGNWEQYAALTAMGYDAAKEVFPDINVIVHVDNAYEQRDWFWQAMHNHGGKWDMIGLSHYPMMSAWNGGKTWQEMNDLAEQNIRRLIRQWHCPVMIAEVCSPTTLCRLWSCRILCSVPRRSTPVRASSIGNPNAMATGVPPSMYPSDGKAMIWAPTLPTALPLKPLKYFSNEFSQNLDRIQNGIRIRIVAYCMRSAESQSDALDACSAL